MLKGTALVLPDPNVAGERVLDARDAVLSCSDIDLPTLCTNRGLLFACEAFVDSPNNANPISYAAIPSAFVKNLGLNPISGHEPHTYNFKGGRSIRCTDVVSIQGIVQRAQALSQSSSSNQKQHRVPDRVNTERSDDGNDDIHKPRNSVSRRGSFVTLCYVLPDECPLQAVLLPHALVGSESQWHPAGPGRHLDDIARLAVASACVSVFRRVGASSAKVDDRAVEMALQATVEDWRRAVYLLKFVANGGDGTFIRC